MNTYVYEGTEVKKTGRVAVKTLNMAGGKQRQMTLVEITPVDTAFDWKKWVSADQLYEVKDSE